MLGLGKLLIGLVVLGGGVALATHSAHADTVPKGKAMPDSLQKDMVDVINKADPPSLRVFASKLEALGFKEQAEALRKMANEIEAAVKAVPAVRAPEVAAKTPGTPVQDVQDTKERILAGKVALNLKMAGRPNEDRELVRAYQVQENNRGAFANVPFSGAATPDGLYGVGTAYTLAKDHGIVPPKPFYFSKDKKKASQQKTWYKARMAEFAASDPSRAEEWSAAGKIDNQ